MPDHAKREVLSCLRDLADREGLKRAWLQGEPGGPPSPSELACQLFDDTALGEYLDGHRDKAVFSPEADALLAELSSSLDRLDLDSSPQLLLGSPRWAEVETKAAEAADLIARLLSD